MLALLLMAHILFQSTLPQGERRIGNWRVNTTLCLFQSTLPQGERPYRCIVIPVLIQISIHAPARGATIPLHQSISLQRLFQSTLPQGERPLPPFYSQVSKGNFNPRSRKGSDHNPDIFSLDSCISIHAPARGATIQFLVRDQFIGFQSTLPQGERLQRARLTAKTVAISIHAPARGATKLVVIQIAILLFQSTLPQGERRLRKHPWLFYAIFQSTLPQGERLALIYFPPGVNYFNPRSRKGSDGSQSNSAAVAANFNPRSRKGSDLKTHPPFDMRVYFNPRSRKGSDSVPQYQPLFFIYFNPRSRKGSDFNNSGIFLITSIFQSTLPQGERLVTLFIELLALADFNPRSRKGSDS